MSVRLQIFVGSLAIASSGQAAEMRIENPMDDVNEHFAIASEHFGGGQVQLHSRRDGTDGSTHAVYTFDCVDQKHLTAFEGPKPPKNFPMEPLDEAMEPLNRDSEILHLAKHACAEYDHPLLELKW